MFADFSSPVKGDDYTSPNLPAASSSDDGDRDDNLTMVPEENEWDASFDAHDCTELDELDTVETDDARLAIANWHIKALGNRPQDHMARDFLFGSLLRDFRPTWFSRYATEPADWMLPLVRHLPGKAAPQLAIQHVALHCLHRRHLLKQIDMARNPPKPPAMEGVEHHNWVLAGCPVNPPVDPLERRQLARLWRCWPYGVQVEWQGPGERTARDVCGLTWYCPWCLTRRVIELHERLRQTTLRDATGKHLILLRASLPANRFPNQLDDGHLRRTDIDLVRRHFGAKLRALAARLGVDSGLITYQVGPYIADVAEHLIHQVESFRHQLNLLGEVRFRSEQHRQSVFQELGIGDPDADWLVLWESRKVSWTVDSVVMPADDPQALRILLAGSAARYQPRHPVQVGGTKLFHGKAGRDGIPGAFRLEPLFMLDRARWYHYLMAVHGLRMYDAFGAWRAALRSAKSVRRGDPFLTTKERAVRRLNGTKRGVASARRQRLLAVVRPLWNQGVATQSGRGRPARRQHLAQLLKTAGLTVSMRDLKWLAKEVK